MAQEVVLTPGNGGCTSSQHDTEQKEVFDGILEYLRRIDASLKRAFPTEATEEKPVNIGVDASKRQKFFAHVRVWNTKQMISMIQEEPELLLETSTWGSTTCTVFQLAVILNSEKVVAQIDSYKTNPRFQQQLVDTFMWGQGSRFEVSPFDVAYVRGTKGIWAVLEQSRVPEIVSTEEELAEIGALLLRIFDIRVDWGELKNEFGKSSETENWWGEPYGIELQRREKILFIFHRYAAVGFPSRSRDVDLICKTLGPKYITALLRLTDHNGQTPVHISLQSHLQFELSDLHTVRSLHQMVKKYCDASFNMLDVRDSVGRTCLHVAAAQGHSRTMEAMAKLDEFKFQDLLNIGAGQTLDEMKDQAKRLKQNLLKREELARTGRHDSKATALHLAVIHNQNESAKVLVKHGCNINIQWSYEVILIKRESMSSSWESDTIIGGAFQLAAVKGRASILQTLLQEQECYDMGLMGLSIDGVFSPIAQDYPALHLAACSGNPLAVKALLDSGKLDIFALDRYGDTALHFVASCEVKQIDTGALHFVDISQYCNFKEGSDRPKTEQQNTSLGGIIGCIDLLMQAGLGMDHPNIRGETPQLRASAPDELARWWYDKLAGQNQEAKSNLVAAANAVSVTAALVATASFVGPLQPPLGLSTSTDAWLTGYSQVNHTAVQVFLFCDSLSFYLAIASIMLAVIPSFTIPKEGLPMEVRIAKRVVRVAVFLLFASITFVICAFSAASIAIVPGSRWDYMTLAVVTTIMGTLVCSTVLCLFLLRLLRFITPNAKWVRSTTNYVFFSKKNHVEPKKGRLRLVDLNEEFITTPPRMSNLYFDKVRERLSNLFQSALAAPPPRGVVVKGNIDEDSGGLSVK